MEKQPKAKPPEPALGKKKKKKKPYAAPVLQIWGTLRELTLKVGAKGQRDGALKGPRNTRL